MQQTTHTLARTHAQTLSCCENGEWIFGTVNGRAQPHRAGIHDYSMHICDTTYAYTYIYIYRMGMLQASRAMHTLSFTIMLLLLLRVIIVNYERIANMLRRICLCDMYLERTRAKMPNGGCIVSCNNSVTF